MKDTFDRQTDGQNNDSQDCASTAVSRGKNHFFTKQMKFSSSARLSIMSRILLSLYTEENRQCTSRPIADDNRKTTTFFSKEVIFFSGTQSATSDFSMLHFLTVLVTKITRAHQEMRYPNMT